MNNKCNPLYDDSEITAQADGAVIGKRFAVISASFTSGPGLSSSADGGNIKAKIAGAKAKAFGVFAYDAADKTKVGLVGTPGKIVPVTSGAEIAAPGEVESDAEGRAIPLGAGKACGYAISTATGAGKDVFVKLY